MSDATRAAALLGYGGGSVVVVAGVRTVKYGGWWKVAGKAAASSAVDGPCHLRISLRSIHFWIQHIG